MSKAGVLLLVSLFASATIGIGSARSEERFVLDQRSASVEFAVTHFGLFTSHGFFRRFWAILQIDPAHPETVKIRFDIDARSIDIPWRNWIPELLSRAFFDVAEHPDLRFTSTVVSPNGPQHYLLRGFIQIRGVTRLITLKANLVDRKEDHSNGTGIADLIVTGKLKRSQFGMTADRISISDNVKLIIRARLQLNGRPG